MSVPSSDAPSVSPWHPLKRRATCAAGLTLVIGLLLTAAVSTSAVRQAQESEIARFDRRTALVTEELWRSLLSAAVVLRGAHRFVAAATPAPPDGAWRSYVTGLDLDGLQSPVRSLDILDTDTLHDDDPATQRALQRAAESSQPTLAARLVQDNADTAADRPDLALYMALPAAVQRNPGAGQRTDPPSRFVYATLDPNRFIAPELLSRLSLQVSVDHPDTTVYTGGLREEEVGSDADSLVRHNALTFGGTTLQLAFAAPRDDALAPAVGSLAAGILISGVCALLMWFSLTRRTVSIGPDEDNLLNEARMMGIIRSSMEAIITIDERQNIMIFNPAAERVFGVSAMEAIGTPLTRFIPERFRAMHSKHVDQFGVTGVSDRQMGRQRVLFGLRGDGTEFPIEASISQIRDSSGKLYTVMLRDVTERVRAEDAVKQSREELRELSANLQNIREEEKTRIARELHDDLGQRLTALKMDLSAIEYGLEPQLAQTTYIRDQVQSIRRQIDATVASVRRIAADLRPVMLDDLGLIPAIEWLANDFTQRYGIKLEKHIDPVSIEVSGTGATALFRIVQEALTNVARHANATRVLLTLTLDETHCTLRVADDGNGSTLDKTHQKTPQTFGLIGIRERAHMFDGTVTIENLPGTGFALTVRLPLQSIQQREKSS